MLMLREARPDEIPAVVATAVQTAVAQRSSREVRLGDPAGVAQRVQEMYGRALAPGAGGRLVIGEAGGAVAGYLLLGLDVPPGRQQQEATVLDVWVSPAWRGRALSGVLHRVALALAAAAGAVRLKAMVALHNQPSLAAHRRSGFTPEDYVCGKAL